MERLEARDVPAVFTVTTTADSGPGSLRQAILDANANPGADTVRFQIGSGPQTIQPLTALPDITGPTNLDATTQPGYYGYPPEAVVLDGITLQEAHKPLITLDGSLAPVGASGLVLSNHTGSTVRGFVIENFNKNFTGSFLDAAGINIRNGGGHTIQNDYIGTGSDGSLARPNGYAGILINNSANNLIGGTTAAARNIIAGNRYAGVYIANPGATGNKIQGNLIGIDSFGSRLPNGDPTSSLGGVVIGGFGTGPDLPAGNNPVGGTDPGAGNVIANERYGVFVSGSTGNSVLGNSLRGDGTAVLLDGTFHANDSLDADTGANGLQNQPAITGVTQSNTATAVHGILTSTPNATFRVELYLNKISGADFWGNGQADQFLTAVQVTTDASGMGSFDVTLPVQPIGQFLSATATNLATGDTSPVSRPFVVPAVSDPGPGPGTGAGLHGYAVAAASGEPRVWLYNADGTLTRTFLAYDAAFRGGVHVATGDVNGDGVLDVITAPAGGGGPHVKVFDGATGNLIRQFFAYDPGFVGGVNLAAADLTGDGKADVITGAGPGGGPHVEAFDGATGARISSFFPYDWHFLGGVSVAAGDVDGDGQTEIVTAPGATGGPHVRIFRGAAAQPVRDFMAYDWHFLGGVSLAVGDFDGDGKADIATAPLGGGGPHVLVFSGTGTVLSSVMAADPGYTGGVHLAMRDVDNDGAAEVLGTVQANGHARVVEIEQQGAPTDLLTLDPSSPDEVFIG
jgi:hypothetical protein